MSIIGKKTKSRGTWGAISPVTRIKESKKKYDRRKTKRETKGRLEDY